MKSENRFFDVTPKVVRADQESVIEIRPRFDHCRFSDEVEYAVAYFPAEEFAQRSGWPQQSRISLNPTEGVLRIPQYFEDEQEHVLCVEHQKDESQRLMRDFRVY